MQTPSIQRRWTGYLLPGLLPLLAAVFPAAFYFANNAEILNLSSLWRMAALAALLGMAAYLATLLISRRPYSAALAAFIFIFFFYTYGAFYDGLVALDVMRVTHLGHLPLYLMLGVYASLIGLRMRPPSDREAWRILTIATAFLVALNLARLAPVEIRRAQAQAAAFSSRSAAAAESQDDHLPKPDIYFLIFDEAVGFDAMRQYWQNDRVDDFSDWLKQQGFYVAEASHSQTHSTIEEMARRLNYEVYKRDKRALTERFQQIADNRVMNYLKAKGYTTIVFDEARSPIAYPAKTKILADINFEDDPALKLKNDGSLLDEFGMMLAEKSMLRPYVQSATPNNGRERRHQTFIYFTIDKLGDLQDVSPKFVYAHLILPHLPFQFNEDGSQVDPIHQLNWDYYEGNYNFSLLVARQMIENILADADPQNPPIIILQSDHGARNGEYENQMENYPQEYKSLIINAMLIPSCPDAPLTPDVMPINTFPIVLNCAFDAHIPVSAEPPDPADAKISD